MIDRTPLKHVALAVVAGVVFVPAATELRLHAAGKVSLANSSTPFATYTFSDVVVTSTVVSCFDIKTLSVCS